MVFEKFNFLRFIGVISLVILCSLLVLPSVSLGQEYPTKPIQLVVTWAPGGIVGTFATMLAEKAKEYIPKPVVVIYKPGASGSIGTQYVSQAEPDGYTLILVKQAQLYAPLFEKMTYSYRDFESICHTVSSPMGIAVKQDAPWKTLRELIDYAKKNPSLVTMGNAGLRTSQYLTMLKFEKMAGIKLTHVPFKGGANESLPALAGGHISCAVRYGGDVEALFESGKLRLLTVFDSKRSKLYPNVPASKEEGFDMEIFSWTGLMAPKGTPKAILKYWENFMEKLSRDKMFTDKAEKLKMVFEFMKGEDFMKYLDKDITDISEIIKQSVSKQ